MPKIGLMINPYKVLLASILILLFFHDFIFLNMAYALGGQYGLNLWKELISLIFLCLFFCGVLLRGGLGFSEAKIFIVLAMLLLALLVFGDFSEASLRTFRSVFTPFVFAVMVGRLMSNETEQRFRFFLNLLLFIAFLGGGYGLYQSFSIKEWQDFWYYHPLISMDLEIHEYDSFRDGVPRISGFFTSPLDFSFFIVFVFFIGASSFFVLGERGSASSISKKGKLFLFLILSFLVYIVFQSTVRSAQLCLFTAFGYLLLLLFLKSRIAVVITGGVYVLSLSVATFLYIGLGYTDDLSALGRLEQWGFLLTKIVSNPLGLGFASVGPGQQYWFDSFWLNLMASFGLCSIFFIVGFIFFYFKLVGIYISMRAFRGSYIKSFSLAVLVLMPVFFYGALFQSFYNSPGFYLLLMIVSMVLYGTKASQV